MQVRDVVEVFGVECPELRVANEGAGRDREVDLPPAGLAKASIEPGR